MLRDTVQGGKNRKQTHKIFTQDYTKPLRSFRMSKCMHAYDSVCICVCVCVSKKKNLRMSGKTTLFKACCSRAIQVLRQLFCQFALSNPPPLLFHSFHPSLRSTVQSGLISFTKPRHHQCSCLNKSFPLIKVSNKMSNRQLAHER